METILLTIILLVGLAILYFQIKAKPKQEENVTETPPYQLAEKGLAYVPQENNVFPDMTVYENLSVGSLIGKRSKKERIEEIFELFPGILDRVNQKAGSLSVG